MILSPDKDIEIFSVKTGKRKWKYSQFFVLVGVVKDWGALPSDFGLCEPSDNLAVMAEHSATVNQMSAIQAWKQDSKNPKNKKKGKK